MMPNVITRVHDEKESFTLQVRSCRELTPEEMRIACRQWNRQGNRRKPVRNKVVEVVSIIGQNG